MRTLFLAAIFGWTAITNLTGCARTEGNVNSVNDLAGVWDVSPLFEEMTPEASSSDVSAQASASENALYMHIASDGRISLYDYQAEDLDGASDCYTAFLDGFDIEHVRGSTFRISIPGEEEAPPLFFTASLNEEGELVFTIAGADAGVPPLPAAALSVTDLAEMQCPSGGVDGLEDVIGLWDGSNAFGAANPESSDGVNEIYFFIAEDGRVSVYDYQGDSFDAGENCYEITRDAAQLVHVSDNTFRIFMPEEGSSAEGLPLVAVLRLDEAGALVLTLPGLGTSIPPFPPSDLNVTNLDGMECTSETTETTQSSGSGPGVTSLKALGFSLGEH